MQLLSPHLSLEELTFSSTAIAHGIDNTAPLPELHRRLRENENSTSSLWTVIKVTWAVILAIVSATWMWVKH